MILAGTSRFMILPFTLACECPICKLIDVRPFVAITVSVSALYLTTAPNVSNIALKGAKVLPFSINGGTSKLKSLPSIKTLV
jgi:hypothetical protein